MKTVEFIVRFNVDIPEGTEELDELYLDIPDFQGIRVMQPGHTPIETSKVSEYETLEVESLD